MSKKSVQHESATLFSPEVAELVAIGASIAANCETCFKYHYSQARKLGVSREDMASAVEMAQKVKCAPARNMLLIADRILETSLANQEITSADTECCCSEKSTRTTKGKCC